MAACAPGDQSQAGKNAVLACSLIDAVQVRAHMPLHKYQCRQGRLGRRKKRAAKLVRKKSRELESMQESAYHICYVGRYRFETLSLLAKNTTR